MLQTETGECIPLSIPQRFGDYRAHKVIGYGTTCAVIEAYDRYTGRDYAVKVMSLTDLKSRGMVPIVEQELAVLRRVHDSHIIEFREFLRQGDLLFFVAEHCQGGDLFSWISSGRISQQSTVKRLCYEVALAVQYLHSQGIAPNDIRPEHILVSATGHAKLAHFGHAHHADRLWPPAYIAPELFRSRCYNTEKVDIWAIGILLCVMATGAFPFKETDRVKVARQIRHGRLKYPRTMDREVEALVRKMTKANPNDRPTIDAVLEDPYFDEIRASKQGRANEANGIEFDDNFW